MSIDLILGDVKSGKTAHAVALADEKSTRDQKQKIYLATAQIFDPEMQACVQRHQKARDENWFTLEAPLELSTLLQIYAQPNHLLVIDSLTLWLKNHFLAEHDIKAKSLEFLKNLEQANLNNIDLILVSDDISLDKEIYEKITDSEFYRTLKYLNEKIGFIAHQKIYLS